MTRPGQTAFARGRNALVGEISATWPGRAATFAGGDSTLKLLKFIA